MRGIRTRLRGAVLGYLRSTGAAATAVTGVAVTLMAFMGAGLAGDYAVLLGQRDLLKTAADAATIATIKHFSDLDLNGVDDAQLDAALRPVARRYILANIPQAKRAQAASTLQLTITPNRATRTVAITAQADLGGLVFLDGLFKAAVLRPAVESGAIGDISSSEVVLAIDVTSSMFYTIEGDYPPSLPDYSDYPSGQYPFTRMNVVKAAAADLVNILNPDGHGAAIGIVPWHYRVRLGADQRSRWISENWARYASQRTYPRPYRGAPSGGETTTMPPEAQRPSWNGCFDQRSLTGTPPAALASVPPWDSPFTMSYYTDQLPGAGRVGFTCRPKPDQDHCYDPAAAGADISYRWPPQEGCDKEGSGHNGSPGFIVPLTADADRTHRIIGRLSEGGPSTYSAIGMVWALRLLDPVWRPVWGDPVLPRNASGSGDGPVNKAIVLLTDGEDNHTNQADQHLARACTEAKNAGVRIFVVTAMALSRTNDRAFIRRLEDCSSKADFPDAEHVFVNNATPEALRNAFQTIALQLQKIRRTK